jgi:hypothetical protein
VVAWYTARFDITYLLTPCSRVLLGKLTGLQLVKKFPAFYGTRRFVTAFTSASHMSLSLASSIQPIPPHSTSWRSVLSHVLSLLRSYQVSVQVRGFVCEYFVTKIRFHLDELLPLAQPSKLEDHPLSAVRDYLFNIFAATLCIGGRSSIRNMRTRHAVVTGTHLSHGSHIWHSTNFTFCALYLFAEQTEIVSVY